MIKQLKDIIRYAHDTGSFENILLMVKEDGNAGFTGMSKDSSLHLKARFKDPISELSKQSIGMTRLDVLAAFLRSSAFSGDDANKSEFTIKYRENDNVPKEILLKSPFGHTGVYRFMSPAAAKARITVSRSTASISEGDIKFKPSEQFLKDFQTFAGVLRKFNSHFSLEAHEGILYMNLGQDDTARIPVTTIDEGQQINATYTWPIENLLKALKQAPSLDAVEIAVSQEFGMIEVGIESETSSVTYRLLPN